MDNRETTALLSTLIERDVLGAIWSREVSYAKLEDEKRNDHFDVGGRVDYLSFSPAHIKHGYDTTEDDILNGFFCAYEIKSCLSDFKSGCGLNFVGDYNYLVVTMGFYNELMRKRLIPNEIGVMAPVPMYKGKQQKRFFESAINRPMPLTNNENEWRLHAVRKAKRVERKHGTSELLYAMLRSGK